VCCRGCASVAEAIRDWGLERFYKTRTGEGPRPNPLSAGDLARIAVFDDPAVQRHFLDKTGGTGRAALILERIVCPACCWLIERRLSALPGVIEAQVDYTTARARVAWNTSKLRLSEILRAVADLGYGAQPYEAGTAHASLDRERRAQLRRLALAGLFGMQVMMISIALYFGTWGGIEDLYRRFLQWTALLLTVPLIVYSGMPFFQNAWRDLRAVRVGMDVPVSLGLLTAFLGSMHATWSGGGEVYFDSVAMFVFLLLGGRYLEFNVRRDLASRLDWLYRIEPAVAALVEPGIEGGAGLRTIPAVALRPGDRILVRPGEYIPADGTVLEGDTGIDESLITGESMPVRRGSGDRVIGGSSNVDSPIQVRVDRVGDDTTLAVIRRLAERCSGEKPALTEFANRISGWFVAGVLLLAGILAWYWLQADPARWLPVTISVLVITCPCALALATPTALAAAAGTMLRGGMLVVRANAVEMLARASLFAFDKTGTLTLGQPVLRKLHTLGDVASVECLRIAAALESGSSHPLAGALLRLADAALPARSLRHFPGEGVTGEVNGRRYFLGNSAFIRRMCGDQGSAIQGERAVLLASEAGVLAEFEFADKPRPGTEALISWLQRRGRHTLLLSGDRQSAVADLGTRTGVDEALGGLRPEDKVSVLKARRDSGQVVCMTGDGVNDAPVLAAAHVSVAMGGGTDLAKINADLILLDNRLESMRAGIDLAGRTLAVIHANVAWAVGYNLVALPLAAFGWVPPWLAALGMSASSLLVTANSARLMQADSA
jgi:Cu2+-exporting ATPase